MTQTTPDGLVPSSITGRQLEEAAQYFRASYTPDTLSPWQYSIELAPAGVRIRRTWMLPTSPTARTESKRSSISHWSHRSRTNLIWRLSTLDYAPMVADGCLPMLLTLTYPGAWETVAPTGAAAKRHLAAFRRRFERKFGKLFAVWVMEWQRSGAPHFHLMLAVDISRRTQMRVWIAHAWADIVAHPDPVERKKHERAGTQLKLSDHGLEPRVAAIYFVKHAAPGRGSKWYQKVPPQLWIDAGSVGRLWGYWGLSIQTVIAPLAEADAKAAARRLRKWDQKRRGPQRVRVTRTDTKTGEVRYRWAHRRAKQRLGAVSGFLTLREPLTVLRELALLPVAARDSLSETRGNNAGDRAVQRVRRRELREKIREHIQRASVRAKFLARLVRRYLWPS